jgi:hypothetical protein
MPCRALPAAYKKEVYMTIYILRPAKTLKTLKTGIDPHLIKKSYI